MEEEHYTSVDKPWSELLDGYYRSSEKRFEKSLFRGQWSDWPLQPTALRPNYPDWVVQRSYRDDVEWGLYGEWTNWAWYETPRPTNLEQVESELLSSWQFFFESDRQGLHLPEDGQQLRNAFKAMTKMLNCRKLKNDDGECWPYSDLLSLLALAQHSGLPTRLLDWTWNPFTAAYFAAVDCLKDGINERKDIAILQLMHPALEDYSDLKCDPFQVELVTAPLAQNANLRAQEGIFTLLKFGDDIKPDDPPFTHPVDEVLDKYFHFDGTKESVVTKHLLPQKQSRDLLRRLSDYGYNRARLFPTFNGVVGHLRDKRRLSTAPTSQK